MSETVLLALDGANPLGFLAALGTLEVLRGRGVAGVKLGWRAKEKWTPYLVGVDVGPKELCHLLAGELRGADIEPEAGRRRDAAREVLDAAKKAAKAMRDAIKKRKLPRADRLAAERAELEPLEDQAEKARRSWLAELVRAVRAPELALGDRPDCTEDEFRERAADLLGRAGHATRSAVDLLAAFGTDACVQKSGRVAATPFCLITGSGHQFFLDTAGKLMAEAGADRVHAALFEPWAYEDETLSMRWDPAEDRRYALMDRDPTASDNKSRTVWMANLLGYRALALFPSAPSTRGLATTAWTESGEDQVFCWPIWEPPADADTVRSLLQQRELAGAEIGPPERAALRARGVAAIYRARRIQVGNPPLHKLNLSPARGA